MLRAQRRVAEALLPLTQSSRLTIAARHYEAAGATASRQSLAAAHDEEQQPKGPSTRHYQLSLLHTPYSVLELLTAAFNQPTNQ